MLLVWKVVLGPGNWGFVPSKIGVEVVEVIPSRLLDLFVESV